MLKKFVTSFLFLSALLFSGEIKIAVASDTAYPMQLLKKEFNKEYPNINLKIILGHDAKVTLFIKQGIPYEVLLSSNKEHLESLYKNGLAVTEPSSFALDDLVIYSERKRDFSKGMEVLKDKKISKIFILDPKTTQYGKSAVEAIKRKKIYEDIKNKLVYVEAKSQLKTFALSKNDVGITSKASLYNPRMSKYKKGEHWAEVNIVLFTPIDQSVVILKSGKNNKDVKAFYDFLFSDSAKKILKKFGYIVE